MIRRTAWILFASALAGVARAEMPQELVERLTKTQAPTDVRAEVDAGRAPAWIFEPNTGDEEISVAGVVELPTSPERAADELFRRPSLLETENLTESGSFSEPATLADVADYHVPESDLEVLADCEVHACKFKLGERALKELESIDWNAPDAPSRVDTLVRRRIVELVGAYQKEGRSALGRYLDKPDARTATEATGLLFQQILPGGLLESVRTYLESYPKSRSAAVRDRLHWNVRDYGYRPITSIVHTVAFAPKTGEPARLVAATTLYSSHYFYARLQLMGLYTDTADPSRTYAIVVDRLLFDEKVGSIQRRALRAGVLDDVQKQLGKLRATHAKD